MQKLSETLGVGITTLHRWETGECLPDARQVTQIAVMTNGLVGAESFVAVQDARIASEAKRHDD